MGFLRRALFGGRPRRESGAHVRRTVGPGETQPPADSVAGERSPVSRPREPPPVSGPADAVLTGAVVALICFGVVMVYSASAVLAYSRHHDGQYFLVRQAIYALVGLFGMIALARFDYHRLRSLTYPMMAVALGLLAYVAFGHGKSAGGATRWIEVGPIHIQPAEIAKVVMICWLAHSLSKKHDRIRTFKIGFLPHLMVAVLLMWLCIQQPDFGSAVMVAGLTFVLLFAAGARPAYIIGALALAAPLAYRMVMGEGYRARRILAYLAPFEHRYGAGYQVAESLMSFGAGGWNGVGIGDGRQKLFFLPEAHTDFISAIVGEELGYVGFCLLVLAYLVVLHRGFRAAFRAVDEYGTYLAVGITMFIGMQAFTNLAVALGMVPPKGLVLPFVSFGGSALLVNCGAVGVLLNVSRPRRVSSEHVFHEGAQDSGKLGARVAHRGGVA